MKDPHEILAQIAAICRNVSPMAPREDLARLVSRLAELAESIETPAHIDEEEEYVAAQAAHEARKEYLRTKR